MEPEVHPDWINPNLDLVGVDGHPLIVMGTVTKALKRAGNSREVVDAYRTAARSGDYDDLLLVSMVYAGM